MGISLSPENVRRYKDIAVLLMKHARRDLVEGAGTDAPLAEEDESTRQDAEALASDLERMGPTFVKLGQLLSTRADLLPPAYLEALARLQDSVEAVPFDEIRAIVEGELGIRLSDGFQDFESEPLASASLGQVHRAVLRSGRPVAVKVQRPGIRDTIRGDLDALREIAELADRRTELGRRYGLADVLDEFARTLEAELDYGAEAGNLETFRRNLAAYEHIVVPAPVRDYSTTRVLTMELVRGKKVTDLGPLGRMELDGPALADELFGAYVDQILRDGLFHADPHPGNVLITEDGRLALIDLGMVARIGPRTQDRLVKLLLAVSDGRGEETAEVLIDLGERLEGFDESAYRRRVADLVGRHQSSTLGDLDAGRIVVELARVAGETGLRPPPELTLLGKALLNLDMVAKTLDPDFDPNRALRARAGDLLEHRLRSGTAGQLLTTALEAKELVEHLPARINRLLDSLARGEFRVQVDAIDEDALMRGFQKVANRVTMGLVIAALIMGAALLMRVPSEVRILGYPAVAIVLFVVAAASGLGLVLTIFLTDRRD